MPTPIHTPRARTLLARARIRAGAWVADHFFAGASAMGRLHPRSAPERHQVEVLRDIPYAVPSERHHLLDIYRPLESPLRDAQGRLPVVFYVHGGGFRILSKDTHWVMALAFARNGYLVFNINYRLAPLHPFPAAIEDVCRAYCWVIDHAAEYGGDVGRLAVAGESAGGNLVTSLMLSACYPRDEPWARAVWDTGIRPRAALPACGLYQVTDTERFQRRWPKLPDVIADRVTEVTDAYLGGSSAHESIDFADPLLLFERGERPERPLPPFFLGCGTADPLIDDTRRLDAALKALDVLSEAHYFEGEPHAFHALVFRKNAKRYWGHALRFLDEQL